MRARAVGRALRSLGVVGTPLARVVAVHPHHRLAPRLAWLWRARLSDAPRRARCHASLGTNPWWGPRDPTQGARNFFLRGAAEKRPTVIGEGATEQKKSPTDLWCELPKILGDSHHKSVGLFVLKYWKYCRPTAKSSMGWCKRSNPADPNSVHMGHGNISSEVRELAIPVHQVRTTAF